MKGSDVIRVLKGISVVTEHVIARNGPTLRNKAERVQFHVGELIKAFMEINRFGGNASDDLSSKSEENNVSSTKDPFGFPDASKLNSEVMDNVAKSSKKDMKARAVPASPTARLFGFGSLAVRMAVGVAKDNASKIISGDSESGKRMSSENADRLAEALCRMRGAALKLGQMLSIQDENSISPTLARALERVRQSADYMPREQLEAQLVDQLGPDWRKKFLEFSEVPIAAASIGQVHKAVLLDNSQIALKIQYPGVADSIQSDLANLKRLVQLTNLLPPGLYVDEIIRVAGSELAEECNYEYEAYCQKKYRELVLNDPLLKRHVYVPKVYEDLSTKRILASELIKGIPVDYAVNLSQEVRNALARTMLILTFKELFAWNFMQSDPNFANFLFDAETNTVHLIDFGASREYRKEFVEGYMKLVWASASRDSDTIMRVSKELGFLTGDETQEMMNAHLQSGLVIGEPFVEHKPFDFAGSGITTRVSQHGDTFMKYRLTPPPSEAYSLHRKLAGALLLCIKLKAVIPCRDILENEYKAHVEKSKNRN